MRLGYVALPAAGATDLLLQQVAQILTARGLRPVGAVQINRMRADRPRPEMYLQLLPAGPQIKISAENGAEARGCRLDPGALEAAAVLVAADLAAGADALIINKFGKQEAEGRGLAGSVSEALAAGVPVICGLTAQFMPGFEAFAAGHARALPSDAAAIADWVMAAPSGPD